MREIKFRAWDTTDKIMRDVTTINGQKVMFTDDKWDWYKRERIIMQYTGLKDKNGKDVYDGDIYLNLDSGLIGKFKIMNGIGGYHLHCTEYKDGRMYNNLSFAMLDTTNFEVIGNIYEHPHLLKGDEANAQTT